MNLDDIMLRVVDSCMVGVVLWRCDEKWRYWGDGGWGEGEIVM